MVTEISLKRISVMLGLIVISLLILPTAGAQDRVLPPWRESLPEPPDEAPIVVGDVPLEVQVVRTSQYQSLGLGYRNELEPGTGMLFVFGDASPQSFWMKGMRFCLDIIWIENGQIVGAAERACPDPEGTADADRTSYLSPEPVTYVLEVPAGWMDEHGFGPGTPVDLSEVPADAGP